MKNRSILVALPLVLIAACQTGPEVDSATDNGQEMAALRSQFTVPALASIPGVQMELPGAKSIIPADEATFELSGDRVRPVFRQLKDSAERPSIDLPLSSKDTWNLALGTTAIHPTLLDNAAENARISGGALMFDEPMGAGSMYMQIPIRDGVEDFVLLKSKTTRSEIQYRVGVAGVAGLRLVSDTLEFLDAEGTPKLRIAPPVIADSAGKVVSAHLRVEGCSYDTTASAPWGRPVVSPGADQCDVRVQWDATEDFAYPILIDPSWTATFSMATARELHRAALLGNGKILVMGGVGTAVFSSAELFDPASGTWSATGSMADTRYLFGATNVTASPTRYVLAAGGISSTCTGGPVCAQTERYNEATGVWSSAGNMAAPRSTTAVVTLKDGSNKAFIAGGLSNSSVVLSTAERYDPVANTWASTAGAMSVARYSQSTTPLSSTFSGDVVLAGGVNSTGGVLNSAERFSPSTGLFTSAGTFLGARSTHDAARIAGDFVLLLGGVPNNSTSCNGRSVKYNPSTNTWTNIATMYSACYVTASVLSSGKVLVEGGAQSGTTLSSSSVYDPVADTWTLATAVPLNVGRYFHTATVYPTTPADKVLVAGGVNGGTVIANAELYTP